MRSNKILIAIIVILAALILKFCIFTGYSQNQIIKLLEKNRNYKNFSSTMTFSLNGSKLDTYFKQNNNLISYTLDAADYSAEIYMDTEKDLAILTMLDYAIKTKISDLTDSYSIDSLTDTSSQLLDEMNKYDYKYIDAPKYHDKKCVHFELKKKDADTDNSSTDYYKAEYYIDAKTGTLEKIIGYDSKGNQIIELEITTELNSVDNGEIKEPDLSNKKLISQ